MILGIIATILFFTFVIWWDGSLIDMVKDWHKQRSTSGPLVEPAPDAFPLRYRSPYVQQLIGTEGVMNGCYWRRGSDGTPIYGYQPRIDPKRERLSPPQSHSVMCRCAECMSELPQFSYNLDMSKIMELHRMGVLSQREARSAWDEVGRRMESPQDEHEGMMEIECRVDYE